MMMYEIFPPAVWSQEGTNNLVDEITELEQDWDSYLLRNVAKFHRQIFHVTEGDTGMNFVFITGGPHDADELARVCGLIGATAVLKSQNCRCEQVFPVELLSQRSR